MEISYINKVTTKTLSTFCQHFEEEMSGASRKLTDVDGGQGRQTTPKYGKVAHWLLHISYLKLASAGEYSDPRLLPDKRQSSHGKAPPCAWRREDVLITREETQGRGHDKQTLLLLRKSLTQTQTLCFMQSSHVTVSLSENGIYTTCFGHFLRSHVYEASLHTYVIKFYFLLFICLMSN